ncbi:MAG: hypothetical protein WCW13_06950 [archaeon]|jgi:hypothetical protein
MKKEVDWRKDSKRVKVEIPLSGKDLHLCEEYLAMGTSCKEHSKTYISNPPCNCPKCKKAERKMITKIQKRVIIPLWQAYLKKIDQGN